MQCNAMHWNEEGDFAFDIYKADVNVPKSTFRTQFHRKRDLKLEVKDEHDDDDDNEDDNDNDDDEEDDDGDDNGVDVDDHDSEDDVLHCRSAPWNLATTQT